MPQSLRSKDGGRGTGVRGQGKDEAILSQPPSPNPQPLLITTALLQRWPLPQPDDESDKEDRGRVLVVGGAPEMPGAVLLAAVATLRAGAGKLQIATCRSIQQLIATAVPEARVIALPETKRGAIALSAAAKIIEHAKGAQAVLIGPGMIDEEAVARLLKSVLKGIETSTLVLDAAALACIKADERSLRELDGRVVLTPHAGEMASMLGEDKAELMKDPLRTALQSARAFGAVIALKGAQTIIAAPDGRAYRNRTGNVGLATSGSGDTLSGIITGLAARGASPLQATVWGVHLHGRAGDRLARRIGPLGFLARELLAEVPPLMSSLNSRNKRG